MLLFSFVDLWQCGAETLHLRVGEAYRQFVFQPPHIMKRCFFILILVYEVVVCGDN